MYICWERTWQTHCINYKYIALHKFVVYTSYIYVLLDHQQHGLPYISLFFLGAVNSEMCDDLEACNKLAVTDIDSTQKDPKWCSVYALEIYNHLHILEVCKESTSTENCCPRIPNFIYLFKMKLGHNIVMAATAFSFYYLSLLNERFFCKQIHTRA